MRSYFKRFLFKKCSTFKSENQQNGARLWVIELDCCFDRNHTFIIERLPFHHFIFLFPIERTIFDFVEKKFTPEVERKIQFCMDWGLLIAFILWKNIRLFAFSHRLITRVSRIFTDPAETFSIKSPLFSEFRMMHIIEIGCVQNCHKAFDFLPKNWVFWHFSASQ